MMWHPEQNWLSIQDSMGEQDMANGIRDLADPAKGNCNIIVDDISYITEPFFRDGVVAKAVDDVVAQGVTFFTSAGNFGNWSYEDILFSRNRYSPYNKRNCP